MARFTVRSRKCGEFVLFLMTMFLAAGTWAADGKLEINEACIAAGCFPGDSPGFPIEITVPGSYVFTGSISMPAPDSDVVLKVQADGVLLDMSGFELSGPGSQHNVTGISVEATRVEIRNGQVRGVNLGIFLTGGGTNGNHSRVIGMIISDYSNMGIRLGQYSLVRDCSISGVLAGIYLGAHSIAESNQVTLTGELTTQDGISVQGVGVIRNNIVRDAPGHGIVAISSTRIFGNIVFSSGLSGIVLGGNGGIIEGNSSLNNQNYGIEVGGGTNHLIRGNNANNNNGSGGAFTNIEACGTCTLIDNHAP